MSLSNILINGRIAEISVSYSQRIMPSERVAVTNTNIVVDILRYAWDDRTIELYESFKVILLNRNNKLLGVASIAEGGITNTVVDVRILFAIALKCAAVAIILAHNHPSGNINPSETDMLLTQKIIEGAKLLEIDVLDHVIITLDSYYSFAQNGNMRFIPNIKQDQLNSEEF